MQSKLCIVTPVSRVANILKIQESFNFIENENLPIEWVLIIDRSVVEEFMAFFNKERDKIRINAKVIFSHYENALGGYAHRNVILNEFLHLSEWFWFIDDDTTLCENYKQLLEVIKKYESENIHCILLNQQNKDLTQRLQASWNNIEVGCIDMGQYILRTKSIPENLRFDETKYEGDGIFIKEFKNHYNNISENARAQFLILPQQEPEYNIYSIYNSLR
jgi:hypothetical protein